MRRRSFARGAFRLRRSDCVWRRSSIWRTISSSAAVDSCPDKPGGLVSEWFIGLSGSERAGHPTHQGSELTCNHVKVCNGPAPSGCERPRVAVKV